MHSREPSLDHCKPSIYIYWQTNSLSRPPFLAPAPRKAHLWETKSNNPLLSYGSSPSSLLPSLPCHFLRPPSLVEGRAPPPAFATAAATTTPVTATSTILPRARAGNRLLSVMAWRGLLPGSTGRLHPTVTDNLRQAPVLTARFAERHKGALPDAPTERAWPL